MWTKIRKKLLETLPESLKGKIDFQMAAYRFGWRSIDKGHQLPTITIMYNGEIVLRTYQYLDYIKNNYHYEMYDRLYFDTDHFLDSFRKYHSMKHYDACRLDDVYFRLFALLDRRVGKRTLVRMMSDLNRCLIPELSRICRIRFEVEGIKK